MSVWIASSRPKPVLCASTMLSICERAEGVEATCQGKNRGNGNLGALKKSLDRGRQCGTRAVHALALVDAASG